MVLELDNFVIKAILLDINNKITEIPLKNYINGFTQNNSASILGSNVRKYKFMINNFEIPEDTKFVTFQISFLKDNKYYSPYLFWPNKNENTSKTLDAPGRAITFKLHNNVFSYIWLYLTVESVDRIINTFEPTDVMIDSLTYMKEYVMSNMEI